VSAPSAVIPNPSAQTSRQACAYAERGGRLQVTLQAAQRSGVFGSQTGKGGPCIEAASAMTYQRPTFRGRTRRMHQIQPRLLANLAAPERLECAANHRLRCYKREATPIAECLLLGGNGRAGTPSGACQPRIPPQRTDVPSHGILPPIPAAVPSIHALCGPRSSQQYVWRRYERASSTQIRPLHRLASPLWQLPSPATGFHLRLVTQTDSI